jgi:uncharacterized protein YecE (DUF72 family)
MTLHVGTSGWAYREWKPGFYPQDVTRSRFLDHYCKTLSACEINATFYRLQSDATLGRWIAAAPESFKFAVKAHRRITHSKKLAPDSEARSFIDLFLRSVWMLGPRLGAVLFQFPPHRHRDEPALSRFLEALPAGADFAIEFRHVSWDDDDIAKQIALRGGTVCVSDTSGDPPDALPPGPIAYVRLRHDRYSRDQRAGWLAVLTKEAKSRHVFAFAKHADISPADPYGGVGLARWLMRNA